MHRCEVARSETIKQSEDREKKSLRVRGRTTAAQKQNLAFAPCPLSAPPVNHVHGNRGKSPARCGGLRCHRSRLKRPTKLATGCVSVGCENAFQGKLWIFCCRQWQSLYGFGPPRPMQRCSLLHCSPSVHFPSWKLYQIELSRPP